MTHENHHSAANNPDKPHPHHVFPPFIQDALADEDPLTVLEMGDVVLDGGVPLPFAAQVNTHFPAWEERIRMGETAGLTDEIARLMDEGQQEYPKSSLWDGYRSFFVREYILAGESDEAVGLMTTMQSQHAQARIAVDMAALLDLTGRDGQALILDKILDTYVEAADQPQLLGYIRALADAYIDVDPQAETISMLEAILAEEDAFFDPLHSWRDSQKIAHPELDWDGLCGIIVRDEHWADVPFSVRRSMMKQWGLAMSKCQQRDFDLAAACMAQINVYNQQFPTAAVWGHLRMILFEASIDDDPES